MFGAFSALRSAKNPKKRFLAKPLFWHICYTSRTKLKHLYKKNVLRFFLYKNRTRPQTRPGAIRGEETLYGKDWVRERWILLDLQTVLAGPACDVQVLIPLAKSG